MAEPRVDKGSVSQATPSRSAYRAEGAWFAIWQELDRALGVCGSEAGKPSSRWRRVRPPFATLSEWDGGS